LETRDWSNPGAEPASIGGQRGGIIIVSAAPLSFPQPVDSSLWAASGTAQGAAIGYAPASSPAYEPGLPAVRAEHNVVRVPLSYAFGLVGLGPFSIVNNHFACGGLITAAGGTQLAQTVLILNLGVAIDLVTLLSLPSRFYNSAQTATGASTGLRNVSNGTVLFTNNVCQLEASASGQTEGASVFIFTVDALIFSNNHCWVDASGYTALLDVLLFGISLNAVSNRFEEAVGSVYFSGITLGLLNVTGQNISTYCLIVLGAHTADNNNLSLLGNVKLCISAWDEVERILASQ
jgi:hypothetical protein